MNKDQEILAVSRMVFELTRMGDADLDEMLARLFDLMLTLPGLRVRQQSVLLLHNRRGVLTQVAQLGLPPAWLQPLQQKGADEGRDLRRVSVATPATHLPPLSFFGVADDAPCFVLPILCDGQVFGRLLVFIEPDWQPDAVEHEFMNDLAQSLSVLVSRCIINETLRVREIELEAARADAIRRLGTASEYRDNETGMHLMRMTHFATSIARALNLSLEERELLAVCAPMHDVGKIGIPDAILLKQGRLSEEEFAVMKTHTEIGSRLLTGDDPLIQMARQIAENHHERWDGSGYPRGLSGAEIPLLARICAVSDVFDALTSSRPYKRAWPVDEAIAWVREHAGTQFDPAVVAAFDAALPDILRIRELYRDDIIDPKETLQLPEMPHRNHGWVHWEDRLSVGIDVIDEHHRYLFDLTNDLFETVSNKRGAREVARVLRALDQYVQVHFRAEEKMMAHYGHAGLQRQTEQHGEFEQRLRGFYEALHENPLTAQFDVLVYLRNWLVSHIQHEDASLRQLVTQ